MHRAMPDIATLARLSALALILVLVAPSNRADASRESVSGLDSVLQNRAALRHGESAVIVRTAETTSATADLQTVVRAFGGRPGRSLPSIAGVVAIVPNAALAALSRHPLVKGVSLDRTVAGALDRTGITIGTKEIRQELGYDGAGVGVAIIDSGVTTWHDDLMDASGVPAVVRFVDLLAGQTRPYDNYGHGTHVAGIIAGNGYASKGRRSGIAPAAHLLVLKTLDGSGRGRISDVIAGIEYVLAHREALNIRILNLSIAAAVYESYSTDPLTLAAERAVTAGIVVVAASGNNGVSPAGRPRYRGVTAPGNAPWVLTVGASSHMGTTSRSDDVMADFSSRGPGAIDHAAKPDLVAPGVGVESLAAPASALYSSLSAFLLSGAVPTSYMPYLSMSGTSMSAPVVTGTVALMLQANPALTPNAVKAILQYTAQVYSSYDPLTQGAGFLNAKGAVRLARYMANPSISSYPDASTWSRRLLWGNYTIKNGRLTADANAWASDVVWGAAATPRGDKITWGVSCANSSCENTSGPWTWSNAKPANVVWGALCGGADCTTTWTVAAVSEGDTVVWGTSADGETVVWGTTEGETVVWGTNGDAETVVWGTSEGDTVVWGTSCSSSSCVPTVWRE